MSVTTPSPFCLVNGSVTTNGVDVAANSLVTIQLQDTAGVAQWNIICINTDDLNSAAVINAGLAIDLSTKTATFTAPNTPVTGSALIFQSKVNNGVDPNGIQRPDYITTFKVAILTSTLLRIFAFDEQLENNANFGWLTTINEMIRSFGTAGGLLAGDGLFVGGGAYNVGQNADGSIIVNADDIQLKLAYQTLLDDATSSNTPNTLVLRDGLGDFAMHDLTCRNITMGDSLIFTTPGIGVFAIGEANATGVDNSSPIFFGNGGAFDGNSGDFFIFTGSITGGGSSGQLLLTSGEALNNSSGQVTFKSGSVTGGSSGSATFGSGSATLGITGPVTLSSGNGSGAGSLSGTLTLKSGNTTTGASGIVTLTSGTATTGSSGALSMGSGSTAGSGNSGAVIIASGPVVSGTSGDITIATGANSGGNSGDIYLASRGFGISLGSITPSFASGKNVIFIANATTVPVGIPSGGGILYVQSGALKYKGSSGNTTTIAPA